MISGAHAIIFTKDADSVRVFLRDVLGLSSIDAGGDDLYATVAELQDKGVKFTRPIKDAGWGLLTALELPDGRELAIYEPRHPRPLRPSG
jgi:hypothetical protein